MICKECGTDWSKKPGQDRIEANSELSDLLVAQAKLIDYVWRMAECGREAHETDKDGAIAALLKIIDKIKRVMLTGN